MKPPRGVGASPSPRLRLACAVSAAVTVAAAPVEAWAAAPQIEKAAFTVPRAAERDASVVGELRIPPGAGRRPAVLIVNSSPGFDGRGDFYAQALNAAGIATFEVDWFHGRGLPVTPVHNLAHAWASLAWLAAHPRIDGARVGIMGWSWGGIVALLAASDELARRQAGGPPRFAAHLALYPICWRHHAAASGRSGAWRDVGPSTYRRLTGRPVHVLAGERDDYDGADGCRRFVAALPREARRHVGLTVYPRATFAWDSRHGSAPYEASARQGKGGIVNVVADTDIARQSREFAATWFGRHLGASSDGTSR